LIALVFASVLGLITGFLLSIKNFYLKSLTTIILNALMGIPPVVVGLIVYFLFARSGPLGVFELLYTPYAMIVAQSIIIFPIVSSLSHELFEHNWKQFKDHFRAFNIPLIGIVFIMIRNNYYIIITIILSGFGRAISEVGAVMIVGGNIEHYTRVMTTAITLQTRMGNLDYAMALGIVLILITVFVNSLVYILKK
jgi:tungstate transport system permease protein